MRPARVAFVSPTGPGKLGDAAILEAFLAGLRRRRPGAEIVGFPLPDLGLWPHTLHDHVKALRRHFGVQSRGELLARCLAAGETSSTAGTGGRDGTRLGS